MPDHAFVVVQLLSCIWFFVTSWAAACQAFLSSTISWSCSNSCPLSWWCYLTIYSFVAPFFFCPQSFPESGSFPMSWLFTSGGQRTGPLASASVLPMNIQCWFPLGFTGLISLNSKGFSRVFSSTTIGKHRYFSAQSSLWLTIIEHEMDMHNFMTLIQPEAQLLLPLTFRGTLASCPYYPGSQTIY